MPDWAQHVRPRLSALHLSPARENEIVEELSQHLEDRWRDLLAGGATEGEAARLALAEFREGDLLARYMAPLRQANTPAPITPGAPAGPLFRDLWQDLRYAARALRKQPAFTLTAVLTLALGIGANTAIFSVVENVVLSPLPYPDEGRIVRVQPTLYASRRLEVQALSPAFSGGDRGTSFSPRGYWHFVNNNRSFEKFGGYRVLDSNVPLIGGGPAALVRPGAMTLSAFEALGVFPELGRLPTPEEDAPGGPGVVLLSHDLWMSRYGGDPSVLGRIIALFGPREVIGVMPAGYDFPTPEIDVWIPLQLNPASANFGAHTISAIARLAPGVTVEAAVRDSRRMIARFEEAGYSPNWLREVFDGGATVRPLRDEIVGDARQPLLIVLGTVGFVLLIACGNVANLLLVRAEGRRQENAMRMALGSSRSRLARHMLVESAMLALMGGATGVLLAYAGTRAIVSIGPPSIPRLDEIGINGTVLLFTALVSTLSGLLFGVLPAVQSSSSWTLAALRDGSRGATFSRHRHRTRNALIVTQVALALVLVIGSGLMIRSFQALRSVNPGFSAPGVLTFQVWPLPAKYEDAKAVAQFYDRLINRLEALPGVIGAGAIDALPLTGDDDGYAAVIEEFPPGGSELPPTFKVRRTAAGYFEAMDIPVVEGRTFTTHDHSLRLPSVIVSKSVKAQYWPDTSALGKRITVGNLSAQVVGVVGDVHDTSLDVPADQFLYLPILDAAGGGVRATAMTMTVRTAIEPLSAVSAIRNAIAELDSELPMAKVQSMERVLGDSMSRTSFTMSVLVIGALIALFLGSIGIYGVLSYVVSQRTPEIGIRSALGASPGALRRMVLLQGIRLAGIGMLIGLAAAIALGRVMMTQLYGVSPADPVTLAAASAIFLAVAALASLLPAARAAGTTPVDALRVN